MAIGSIRDKYSAVWISHSSISDYLRCPRAYFLKNIYRNPKTNRKMTIMQPGLALGQLVHEVLDDISNLPADQRLMSPLNERLMAKWERVKGINGGFINIEEEHKYLQRGLEMLNRVTKNPGPIGKKAIKLRQELPHYWLSPDENIILCGKIDWLEYDDFEDAVKVIDFKTGKFDEDEQSLQLPIYYLLATKVQKRPVSAVQYWYLNRDDFPVDIDLPDLKTAEITLLEIGKRITLARKLNRFVCQNKEGCFSCKPFEKVLSGEAKLIGIDNYNQEVYVII